MAFFCGTPPRCLEEDQRSDSWFLEYAGDSLLIHGIDSVSSSTHLIRRPLVLWVIFSPEGVSFLRSLLSQITEVGF